MSTLLPGRAAAPIQGVASGTAAPNDWGDLEPSSFAPTGALQPAGDFVTVEVYHLGTEGTLHILTRSQSGAANQDGAIRIGPGEAKFFALDGLGCTHISLRATDADVPWRVIAGTTEGTTS